MGNSNLLGGNESLNMSNLNLTNEYSSLSPSSHNPQNLNNSLMVKSNDLHKRIFRKNNLFGSPTINNLESVTNAIGC